ncbi:MAG: redoxin domain-containing protein [Treponema sp.]|jgi:hypothetical protein|nr:redoxin domain-containing protein [Treponema sp.]
MAQGVSATVSSLALLVAFNRTAQCRRNDRSWIISLSGKEIADFSVQAFHEGAFKTVSRDNVLGKWSVFFFYPADFTFVCPRERGRINNHEVEGVE